MVDWRNITITLIDPDFGERTAQAGEKRLITSNSRRHC